MNAKVPDDDPLPVPGGWNRLPSGLLVSPALRPEIEVALRQGLPVALLARASGLGARARELCAGDAHEAAARLVAFGIDLRPLMPSREELVARLAASRDVVESTEVNGRKFKNVFVEIDLRHRGLVLLVSTGSGRKLEGRRQPFVRRLADLIEAHRPAAVFAADQSRYGRGGWVLAEIVHVLKQLEETGHRPFLGAYPKGWRERNRYAEAELLMDGSAAEDEADKMRGQLGSPKRDHTGEVMVDGRVRYGLSGMAPPGFARVRLRGVGGGHPRCVLVPDSPRCYPEPKEVHSGLPETVDEHGVPVDQVENVRFFLANFGREQWQDVWLAHEMCRRRYATDRLRTSAAGGLGAWFGADGNLPGESVFKGILRNLELYRTGVLIGSTGVAGEEPVVVTGCFPPDGPWATAEDFARIDRHLASKARRADLTRPSTFGGLPCTLDGAPAALKPRRGSAGGGDAPPGYTFVQATDDGQAPHRPAGRYDDDADAADGEGATGGSAGTPGARRRGVWVSHADLQASLVEAAAALDGRPLDPYVTVTRDDAAAVKAEQDALAKEDAARALTELQTGRRRQLERLDPKGALAADVEADYQATAAELVNARHAADAARRAADAVTAAAAARAAGTSADLIVGLVDSLFDPQAVEHRDAWRETVRDLAFTVTDERFREHLVRTVSWTGVLVVAGPDGPLQAPVVGSVVRGGGRLLDARALAVLADLRAGVTLRHVAAEATPVAKARLAVMLGLPEGGGLVLGSCADPLLLRLGMAAAVPPVDGETDVPTVEEVLSDPLYARVYDRPEVLAERLRGLWTARRTGAWLMVAGRHETRLAVACAVAADGRAGSGKVGEGVFGKFRTAARRSPGVLRDWTFEGPKQRDGTVVVVPCAWCGGTARARLRLHEPDGLVCLAPGCRRDRAGVTWPAERYDRYVQDPDAWQAAGFALDLSGGVVGGAGSLGSPSPTADGRAPRTGRVSRPLSLLGESERRAVVDAYVGGDRVGAIMAASGLHVVDFYALLHEAAAPLRNKGRARAR